MKKLKKVLAVIGILAIVLAGVVFMLGKRAEKSLQVFSGDAAVFNENAKFVEVGDEGYRVRYVSAGQGEETIIFIHGLGATAYTWRHLMDLLGDKYRVIALDLIGFGLSEKPDVYPSPRFFADFMADFMDKLGIDKAHLVGNSLGGATAAATALWHPDRVDKLVLVGAGGYDDIAKHRPFFVRLSAVPVIGEAIILLSQVNPQSIVRSTLVQSAHSKEFIDDVVVEEFARAFASPGYRRFVLRFTRNFKYAELEKNISQIKQPALLLWGENDTWIPVEFAYRFHEDLPDSKLELVKESGHEPQEERPEITAELIRKFLSGSSN